VHGLLIIESKPNIKKVHLEKVIENPNPKIHTNASMEMILGRKQNENAYIRKASWC
jgi:hypothetical protein